MEAGSYGSGTLGEWTGLSQSVSTPPQAIGVAVANDGVFAFGVAQLCAAAAKHENLRIISWATFLAQKLSYRIAAYLADGVHPTVAGTVARNSVLAASIQVRVK